MSKATNWSNNGSNYRLMEVSNFSKDLPPGVYRLEFDPMSGFYLTHAGNNFALPPKIYGHDYDFVSRVVKTYHNTKDNLGLLLNGVKGTGKTVTGQMICNELKLPVIIISSNIEGMVNYINDIRQDVILFFDEYEKSFEYSSNILAIMDGVLSNEFRRIFVLTTNNSYVNENMLQRPSRIRYVKEYGDLSKDVIMEVVNDLLIHKEFTNEAVEFISNLDIITMDIVKCVIEEINIHKESPSNFADIFNVRKANKRYDLIKLIKKDSVTVEEIIHYSLEENDFSPTINQILNDNEYSEGDYNLYVKGNNKGVIKEVVDGMIICHKQKYNEEKEEYDTEKIVYTVKEVQPIHKSFMM